MGKFQLRKPKIISKNFPEVGSHIDNVSKSLNDLVFTYSEQVDKALQKKHMMMALSSLVLILVVGSFISPKGRADIATFYPDTCLGGWSNPRNGEGEPQTTSNADPSQFTTKNSAVLQKNTSADIYCGNFNGTFNDATTPKKIVVSFAMTNKEEAGEEELTLDIASTTDSLGTLSTSTDTLASSSEELILASSTDIQSTTTMPQVVASSTEEVITENGSTTSASETGIVTGSFVDIIVGAITETFSDLVGGGTPSSSDTDTVVVPQSAEPAPAPQEETPPPVEQEQTAPVEPSPTSYLDNVLKSILSLVVSSAFAEEITGTTTQEVGVPENSSSPVVESTSISSEEVTTSSQTTSEEVGSSIAAQEAVSSSTEPSSEEVSSITSSSSLLDEVSIISSSTTSTTTEGLIISTSTLASTTLLDITTSSSATIEEAEDTQNNFLEILYTFDGVTWISLGELNEISMKYRTFDIPLSATSTWSDLSQLQIKITTKSLERQTPITYLDGIKVEVLYDSTLEYSHPDFARDTILKDETVNGMRIVTIINNENNEEEIWYMYLDEETVEEMSTASSSLFATTTVATSTNATTTENVEESETLNAITTVAVPVIDVANATSTGTTTPPLEVASSTVSSTTTPIITPVIPKNKWFKLEKKEKWVTLSTKELVEEIKKEDKEGKKEEEIQVRPPNFAMDIIRRIKGVFLNAIIVQVEKDGKEELWLYNLETNDKHKIDTSSSTNMSISISRDMQIGIKESYIIWLSEDRALLYAYDVISKTLVSKTLPMYDNAQGERPRVIIEGLSYEVVVGDEAFAFYRSDTGEVFSDDDSSLSQLFMQKLELDKVLTSEVISNLSLPIEEKTNNGE